MGEIGGKQDMERLDEREREWRVALKNSEAAHRELQLKYSQQQARLRRQEQDMAKVKSAYEVGTNSEVFFSSFFCFWHACVPLGRGKSRASQ